MNDRNLVVHQRVRHRLSFGIWTAAVAAAILWGPGVWAGIALFDMESGGGDQVGDYETSSQVLRRAGWAFLGEQGDPDWALSEFGYRLAVTIHNDTARQLVATPIRIDLEGAPTLLFDEARIEGRDLLFTDAQGIQVVPYWVEWFDGIARQGTVWIRPTRLDAGETTFYLYFGNPDRDDPGSAEAVFTYPDRQTTGVVLGPVAAASDLLVESFVDQNSLMVGGQPLSLGAREIGQVASDDLHSPTLVAALGPYYGAFDADGTDALAPMAYASTRFIYPTPRWADSLDIYAPLGDAQVGVYDGQTLVGQVVVPGGGAMSLDADVPDMHALRIESDEPVVVSHRTTSNSITYDAMACLAPARELLGADSGNSLLVALEDDTQVDIYDSSPAHLSITLDAGSVYVLPNPGSQGDGPAVHIIASAPVAALSYGDGDGGESVTYLPRRELGRRYLLPRSAQYVLLSSPTPMVTCRILDQFGQVVAQQTSDGLAPYYPNRLLFSSVAAGSEISCDAPVFAMMEDAATDDERNLWPMKAHRPLVHPEPTADFGDVQTRYPPDPGWLVTPSLEPADGISALIGFLETAQVPAGTSLRYQVSPDRGQTWFYFDGESWRQAAGLGQANDAYVMGRRIASFDVSSSGSVTFRAIFTSDSGIETPRLDELKVGWAGPGEAVRLVFDPVDATQVAGVPFQVTITAVDSLGLRASNFAGIADLATLHAATYPDRTPPFEQGRVTASVAVGEVGERVVLLARAGMIMGQSDSFAVVAPDSADLIIESVVGDQQAGTVGRDLDESLVVKVSDARTGAGLPAQEVTFRVVEGGGLVSAQDQGPAGEISLHTDAGGRASVVWTLGPQPGRQQVDALLDGAEGSPQIFIARADPEGAEPVEQEFWASGGGGCSCGSAGPTGLGLGWLYFSVLCAGLWLRKKRFRPGR